MSSEPPQMAAHHRLLGRPAKDPSADLGAAGFGDANTLDFRSEQHARRFWSSYLGLGFLILAGESGATLIYCVLTPSGPHRVALTALASVTTIIAIASTSLVSHIAPKLWRSDFSFAWTLVAGLLLTFFVYLDGGIRSPLIYMLVLPIASAAVGLSVSRVLICGVATIGELSFVWATNRLVQHVGSDLAMFSAALVGLVIFAIGVSVARSRMQDAEAILETELTSLAKTDALTDCLNHGAFYEQLDVEINRALRHNEPLSLLMIDIDLFKTFNDAYGHVAGDEALAEMGAALCAGSRSFDVVGRIGGDEFAVILPGTSCDEAAVSAERMTQILRHPKGLKITASVGYATLDRSEPTAKRLVRDADSGLYRAKLNGRGRFASPTTPLASTRDPANKSAVHLDADYELQQAQVRQADQAAAEALSILDAYQLTPSVGLGFADRDFRMVRINPMLASIYGGSVENQVGRTIEEIVPERWPQLEPMYRTVIDTDMPVANVEIAGETAADPGGMHHCLTNLYPVHLAGEVIGIGIVVLDVTDQKRLEEMVDC